MPKVLTVRSLHSAVGLIGEEEKVIAGLADAVEAAKEAVSHEDLEDDEIDLLRDKLLKDRRWKKIGVHTVHAAHVQDVGAVIKRIRNLVRSTKHGRSVVDLHHFQMTEIEHQGNMESFFMIAKREVDDSPRPEWIATSHAEAYLRKGLKWDIDRHVKQFESCAMLGLEGKWFLDSVAPALNRHDQVCWTPKRR